MEDTELLRHWLQSKTLQGDLVVAQVKFRTLQRHMQLFLALPWLVESLP